MEHTPTTPCPGCHCYHSSIPPVLAPVIIVILIIILRQHHVMAGRHFPPPQRVGHPHNDEHRHGLRPWRHKRNNNNNNRRLRTIVKLHRRPVETPPLVVEKNDRRPRPTRNPVKTYSLSTTSATGIKSAKPVTCVASVCRIRTTTRNPWRHCHIVCTNFVPIAS